MSVFRYNTLESVREMEGPYGNQVFLKNIQHSKISPTENQDETDSIRKNDL